MIPALKRMTSACWLLVVALHATPGLTEETTWSGSVTLDVAYETSETRNAGGEGEIRCTGVERAKRSYHGAASLRAGAETWAEVRANGEMETTLSCSGRQRCEGDTLGQPGPVRAYSRKSRNLIRTSAEGRGPATVGVDVDEDGGYRVQVEFPSIEGGTSVIETSDRTSGCYPVEPEETRFTDPNWTLQGESAEGAGRVDPKDPGRLNGSARTDQWTTLHWDLRRGPADCGGLARDLERERANRARERSRAEALGRQLRDALGPAVAALAGGETAGQLPAGVGATAATAATQAIGALPAGGGGDAGFEDWANSEGVASAQAQLETAQSLAPSGPVAGLLTLMQQARQHAHESRASQAVFDALAEALRRCRD